MEAYTPTPEIRQVEAAPADRDGVMATADAIELQLQAADRTTRRYSEDCDKNLATLRKMSAAEDRFNSRSF